MGVEMNDILRIKATRAMSSNPVSFFKKYYLLSLKYNKVTLSKGVYDYLSYSDFPERQIIPLVIDILIKSDNISCLLRNPHIKLKFKYAIILHLLYHDQPYINPITYISRSFRPKLCKLLLKHYGKKGKKGHLTKNDHTAIYRLINTGLVTFKDVVQYVPNSIINEAVTQKRLDVASLTNMMYKIQVGKVLEFIINHNINIVSCNPDNVIPHLYSMLGQLHYYLDDKNIKELAIKMIKSIASSL